MLIYFTDSYVGSDYTRKASIEIEELVLNIVKNNLISNGRYNGKDLATNLDPFLEKIFNSTIKRSSVDTLYSRNESLPKTFFIHINVHLHKSQLTVVIPQRQLKTLQDIAAWKTSRLLQSKKQVKAFVSQISIPQIIKSKIESFIQNQTCKINTHYKRQAFHPISHCQ